MDIAQAPQTGNVEFDIWMHILVEYIRLFTIGKLSETITFTANDATPDVGDGNLFKTANTSATTITMFDGGSDGQMINVILGDVNTTIDFTGTNLKGNAGADWTPTTNDHMACISDGTNWYCSISDNTA